MKKKQSKIQWTNYTWNPWHGCIKVSEGCKYCYMYRDKEKYGQDPMKVIKASQTTFNLPLRIKNPSMIFTCSWSDFFVEQADEWRHDAWNIIQLTPQHTYQILTKRPERIFSKSPLVKIENLWMGTSIENNGKANRARYLVPLNCIRFISFEPLLEDIVWDSHFDNMDWIIIGGESGDDRGKYLYRPCKLVWIENLVLEAKKKNIPVFIKQFGTYLAKQLKLKDRFGGNIDEFPEHLRIRQYPKGV